MPCFRLITLMLLMLPAASLALAQESDEAPSAPAGFDAELAAELGADDYGMRRYVMVLLKSGDNRAHDPERVAELQRGHLDNMQRLAEEGVLVLAGPFLDGGDRRGIFVFAVDSVEEAKELTASDPAIEAGRLAAEYWPWYGSAALMKLGEVHERIARESP